MPDVKLGKYRHYKGILVEVIGVALHSETLEELVVYKKLEDFKGYKAGTMWARPKSMFLEEVLVEGVKKPRFELVND